MRRVRPKKKVDAAFCAPRKIEIEDNDIHSHRLGYPLGIGYSMRNFHHHSFTLKPFGQ